MLNSLKISHSILLTMAAVLISAGSIALAQPSDSASEAKDDSFKAFVNAHLKEAKSIELEEVRQNLASPDMGVIDAWITANNESVEALLKGVKVFKQQKLDAALVGIIALPTTSKKNTSAPELTVDEIYEKYAHSLAAIPVVPTSSVKQTGLDAYLKVYGESAQQYANQVIDDAFEKKRIDPKEATRLRITTSLLYNSDSNWTDAVSNQQPEWMRTKDLALVAERYCIYLKRFRTAYSLNKTLLAPPTTQQAAQQTFLAYLEFTSRERLAQKDVTGAYQCAKAALKEADDSKNVKAQVQLNLLIAEIQSLAGNHQIAAGQAKIALTQATEREDRLRAMLLRLKFLFQAAQYEDLLADVHSFKADASAKVIMDRILYLEWITLIRINKDQDAKTIGDKLVKDYPQSQFTSEIHYHNAIQFLVQGKYDDASKELEIVELRYPDSSAAKQAKDMRAKLAKTQKPE